MGFYIDREGSVVGLHSEDVGESTVRVRTRVIGAKVAVDVFEYGNPDKRPVSKTRTQIIVRNAAKPHLNKVGPVGDPISDTTIIRDRNRMDSDGNVTTTKLRVRSATYVMGK